MPDSHIDSLDAAKFVMSVAIVALHSHLGGGWQMSPLQPWLRLAVPIYFLISGYLFFRRYDYEGVAGRRARLARFVLRNAQLYLFWFVVLLAPTVLIRKYFERGFCRGC